MTISHTGSQMGRAIAARARGRKAARVLLASAAIGIGLSGAAFAQARDYALAPGRLSDVLARYAAQSGVQLVYDPAALAQRSSPGLSGSFTVQEGFARLLAGTGYELRATGANSYVLATHDSTAGTGGEVTLGTIVVSGGMLGSHDDTYETAGSVAYISAEEITQGRGTSVGDFIAGIPGVLNGDNRNSGALDVNVRGMQGQGRVPVVIDGASNEQTVYRGYNGARSGSYVDPDFIGEVSVEKGQSAGADASGAIGGIVRMRTLSVGDILLPGRKFGIRLRGGFNTNSTSVPPILTPGGMSGGAFPVGGVSTARDGGNMDRPGALEPTGGNGSIAAAFTSDAVDLVAAYARRDNGNYFAGEHGAGQPHFVDLGSDSSYTRLGYDGLSPWKGGEEVLNTSMENRSLLLKGNFRIGTDQALELGYMRYDSTYGEIMPTRLATPHTSTTGGFQSELDRLDLKTWTARYRWQPGSDLVNLKVDAYRTDMEHRATNLLTLMGITTQTVNWSQAVRDGVTVSNESLIRAIPGEFSLSYGGAWVRETLGLPDDLSDRDWVIDHLEFPPRSGVRTEKSAFLNADWKITPEWQVTAGLRYSDFETRDDNYSLRMTSYWPNTAYDLIKGKETSLSGHGTSKNLSVSWTPREDLQLYARYSDAVRMPAIFETLSGFSTAYLPPDLRPERAKNFEIGVNTVFDGVIGGGDRLRLHAAYYDNSIDDYLTRSNVIYAQPIAWQVGGLGMINLDNVRMRGLELAADYERGAFSGRLSWSHAITSRFCAKPGTLYRQNDRCVEGGFLNSYALQHVPPKDTVTLQLGYRMLEDRLSLGTRVSYYSERFVETVVDSSSQIQPGRWKPYTLVGLFASYKIDEAKQIDVAIDNLTDRYYMDAINAALMPAPGRTARVNFTAKF